MRVNVMHDVFEDGAVLFGAVGFAQVEVGAQADERGVPALGQDFAMEDAALFELVDADVEVVAGFQRQAAEDSVAVVALRVNGVFAVAAVVGEAVAEDVVMRLFGEVGQPVAAHQVLTLHFLQKQDIRAYAAQLFRHAVHLDFAVERGHAFVHVV